MYESYESGGQLTNSSEKVAFLAKCSCDDI